MLLDLFHRNPEVRFFIGAVVLTMVLGFMVLSKASKNYILAYHEIEIHPILKRIFGLIHSAGSLVPALILPNNYLNEIAFIRQLYQQNQIWIPVTMVVLFLFFATIFGILFTFIAKRLR